MHESFSNIESLVVKAMVGEKSAPEVIRLKSVMRLVPRHEDMIELSPNQVSYGVQCKECAFGIDRLLIKYSCAEERRCVMIRIGVLVLKAL